MPRDVTAEKITENKLPGIQWVEIFVTKSQTLSQRVATTPPRQRNNFQTNHVNIASKKSPV